MENPVNIDDDDSDSNDSVSIKELDTNGDDTQSKQTPNSVGDTASGKKNRSEAWKYFTRLPISADKIERCKCNTCPQTYKCSSRYGTGNMSRHVSKCPGRTIQELGQMFLQNAEAGVSVKSIKFDPNVLRDLVNRAIIRHELPLQFVEYQGIREVLNYASFANQEIKLVSRNTSKADIIKIYKNEKENIRNLLQGVPGRISLTSDMWSSITKDGYVSLTAHFVGKDWKLHKRVLNYSYMPSPHTGVAICEKISKLLCEWGIEKKLFSITLDNASNNYCFVDLLKCQLNLKDALLCEGEFFHIRCCAHILNLIVKEGLDVIDKSVEKVRDSVRYFRGSQARKQAFNECVKQVSITCKKGLKQDVPTRWNSTFLMLDSAIHYRRVFQHFRMTDPSYKHCPSEEEWVKLEKICDFLGVFHDVTCNFSGRKYPTSNIYFPSVWSIQNTLKKAKEGTDIFLRQMTIGMFEKFDKYWEQHNMIFVLAVILDPRYKLPFVEFCYKELYGDDSYEIVKVNEKLRTIFEIYSMRSTNVSQHFNNEMINLDQSGPSNEHRGARGVKRGRDLFKAFDEQESESIPKKNELELYLSEPKLKRTDEIDILAFWKSNEFRYPVLSLMARDVLAIPISTVASEAVFSVGKKVVSPYRSTLLPENVEALICTRDWLYEKKGGDTIVDNIESSIEELKDDMTLLDEVEVEDAD